MQRTFCFLMLTDGKISLKNAFKVIFNVISTFCHKFRGTHLIYTHEVKYCHSNSPFVLNVAQG